MKHSERIVSADKRNRSQSPARTVSVLGNQTAVSRFGFDKRGIAFKTLISLRCITGLRTVALYRRRIDFKRSLYISRIYDSSFP